MAVAAAAGLSKSDMARQGFKVLGGDAKLSEMHEWITKKFGPGHELASGHFDQVRREFRDEQANTKATTAAEATTSLPTPSANGHASAVTSAPKVAAAPLRPLTPKEMMRLVKSCRVIINRLGKEDALRLMSELS